MNASVLTVAETRDAPAALERHPCPAQSYLRYVVRWGRALLLCHLLLIRNLLASVDGERPCLARLPETAWVRQGRRRDDGHTREPAVDQDLPCGSYARFSSDLQSLESNADQQRQCRDKAGRNGHHISSELEFSDEAVSGTKRHRAGLDALLEAAEARRIKVLYFHSLSRLSRESVITLPLLKHLVYNCGVRIISVTEGIDSTDTSWEVIAHVMSLVHQQYLKELAVNVFRGQEGAVLAGFSLGDYCFGYTSVPIPGSEKGRRGRNAKPRKMYVVDPHTAVWLTRIFRWFVHERRSLRWIARELNRRDAPKDHRSSTKHWRHQYLPRLLSNEKVLGRWPWGRKRNVRNPLDGAIRQEDRSAEEHQKWLRHFPHLRLIDEETFARAQQLLQESADTCAAHRGEKGKLNGLRAGAAAQHPRHLLSGLIKCGHCGHTFYVGGPHGKYMFCPGYHRGICACQTQLRRDRAEKIILAEIGRRIRGDEAWRRLVFEETLEAWNANLAHLPSELTAAENALAEIQQKIAHLVDLVENGRGGPEVDERLTQRRSQKRKLTEKVERLKRANQGRPAAPTAAWVDEQLQKLGESLTQATPAAAHALRNLVGGQITVREIRQEGRQRHYLQGRCVVRCAAVAQGFLAGTDVAGQVAAEELAALGAVILIDFREPPQYEVESERAKELLDRGWLMTRIGQEMHKAKSYVRKLIAFWHTSRGLPVPDGRARRATLAEKHSERPLYQQVSDEVMCLYHQHLLLEEIAARLSIDRNTVTAAVRWWHQSRHLPVPDGRARRRGLSVKSLPKTEEDQGRHPGPLMSEQSEL